MSNPCLESEVQGENFFPEIVLLEPTLSPRIDTRKIDGCQEDHHKNSARDVCIIGKRSKADIHEIECDETLHDVTASRAEKDTNPLILKANAKRPTHGQKLNHKEHPAYSDIYVFVVCAVLYTIPVVCFGFELVVLCRVVYSLLRLNT